MTSWTDLPFELKGMIADQALADAVTSSCKKHQACVETRSLSWREHRELYMRKSDDEIAFESYMKSLILGTCPTPAQCELSALEESQSCLEDLLLVAPELKAYVEKAFQEFQVMTCDGLRFAAGQPQSSYYRAEQSINFSLLRSYPWRERRAGRSRRGNPYFNGINAS